MTKQVYSRTNATWNPKPETIRNYLLEADLLRDAPVQVVDQLAKIAKAQRLAKNEPLWHEGDGFHFAIVWDGRLEVRRNGVLLDVVLPLQALGHSALLGRQHTATVTAARDSHVFRFDAARVYELARLHFPLVEAILGDTLGLITKLNKDLSNSRMPLFDRLLHRLYWLTRGKKPFKLEITNEQLAELTGARKWTINRALAEMEDTGALRRRFQALEILDLDLVRTKSKSL